MTPEVARYPYETAITAYGNGGFRFAEMSHRGSVICLPSGVYAWGATNAEKLDVEDIDFLLSRLDPPITVLLGTGEKQLWPAPEVYSAFAKAKHRPRTDVDRSRGPHVQHPDRRKANDRSGADRGAVSVREEPPSIHE